MIRSMYAEEAKEKLAVVVEELGHVIRVFTKPAGSRKSEEIPVASSNEEPDDFYDLTPDDYYRLMSENLRVQSQVLKTRKVRDAEAAARRASITKAVIRVHFPDNYILEAKFHPSEKTQTLFDLLQKVIARPDLPFYLYTTPPKERIKDMSKDLYSAGFAPGAIVYFSYDLTKGSEIDSAKREPYLRKDIMSLNGLDLTCERTDSIYSKMETAELMETEETAVLIENKAVPKKSRKPKWLKL